MRAMGHHGHPRQLVEPEIAHRVGVTQKQLATDAGLWPSQVSHWESGQRIPDLPSIVKLANALGYDLALVPRGEDGPLAALSAPVSAQQPSAQGVDGNGPETGTAGATGERVREDA